MFLIVLRARGKVLIMLINKIIKALLELSYYVRELLGGMWLIYVVIIL